jgi:APA family basic amino acid/polyamine antiporter
VDAPSVALLKSLFPTLLLLAVAWPVARGVELSVNLISLIVVLKVGVILLVIAFGAAHVNTHYWHPFIPRNSGQWGEYGWSGVLRAAGIVFYTYLGFDTVSVAAQEARRPQRDVPFALLGSLIVCAVLFVLMMGVVTGLVSYRELNVANPVAVAIGAAGQSLNWLTDLVRITAVISMVSVLVAVLLAASRILFAMAQDGLLPSPIAHLHPRHKTPVGGTLVTVAAAALLTLVFPIGVLAQMVSIGVLSAFIAVAAVVLIWRRNRPEVARPFRVPWVPAVPLGAIVVCGYMAVGLPTATWWRFAAWLFLGLAVYVVYGASSDRRSNFVQK